MLSVLQLTQRMVPPVMVKPGLARFKTCNQSVQTQLRVLATILGLATSISAAYAVRNLAHLAGVCTGELCVLPYSAGLLLFTGLAVMTYQVAHIMVQSSMNFLIHCNSISRFGQFNLLGDATATGSLSLCLLVGGALYTSRLRDTATPAFIATAVSSFFLLLVMCALLVLQLVRLGLACRGLHASMSRSGTTKECKAPAV